MAARARLAAPQVERAAWPWHRAKTLSLPLSALRGGDRRLEAESYLRSGYGLRAALEARSTGWEPLQRFAHIWQPSRLKGIQVGPECGTAFLAATQVFDVRPVVRKWISVEHTPQVDQRFVAEGLILVTCSGAVGRATLAFKPHLETLISHDLLRVSTPDRRYWGWLYAYLRAPTARAMMTSAQYGHIIKHLEVSHLQALPVPQVPDSLLAHFNERASTVLAYRNQSHVATLAAEQRFAECLGTLPEPDAGESGFTVRAAEVLFCARRRLDGLPHNPKVRALRAHLARRGKGFTSIAEAGLRVWLPTRFRRIPAEEGVELLDSSDLFELNPDVTKRIADGDFGDSSQGRVEPGWLLLARSGQIYGINGSLALATAAHQGKIISDHVIRIAPGDAPRIRLGYVLAALSHPTLGRPLVKSLAYGSSIPEIDPGDFARVEVVRLSEADEDYIADQVELAAELRGRADTEENLMAEEAEHILTRFAAGQGIGLASVGAAT